MCNKPKPNKQILFIIVLMFYILEITCFCFCSLFDILVRKVVSTKCLLKKSLSSIKEVRHLYNLHPLSDL